MKQNYLNKTILIFLALAFACQTEKPLPLEPQLGNWQMQMNLGKGNILPFTFQLKKAENHWTMTINNAEEKIVAHEIEMRNDSLYIQLPIFESEFLLAIKDAEHMEGVWANYYKSDDYRIPVTAKYNINYRFVENTRGNQSQSKKYAVRFGPDTEGEYPAIGLFEENGNHLMGTFATETGDYRHLEGNLTADSLFLSTFDGSHAFLFKAARNDSAVNGMFYSGTHYENSWTAIRDESARLKDPDSLTFLKEGYDQIAFSFPNENRALVSLSDERFANKAVILQIMGSWCPNCLDETNYLSGLYDQYKDKGLEIVGLAFERTKTQEKAFENLKRLKAKTGASYEFLLGGATRDDKAAEKLPMLNHIMSYPTAIFIDREGVIRRIHTGFYGPSTGEYYEAFVRETEELVEEMLQ